ncbi:ATP-binding cassette domain-containing protein [Agrobacterium sp. SORGH_AS 787]|uniref:ABC transporter ATP-binding protein n=1 Tax=Agrobacterium sp. SORGH_AS 787 TaxID=3041775 RepID=UPI0027814F78|nr:peptide/nickel transport system ATP-binding protein [Rhizobium sp. SORGH_AS_0787]
MLNSDGSFLSVCGLNRSVPVSGGFWQKTKRRAILQGVDLVLRPGERVGLIGASGSGKTTLLRSLLAIDLPDGGTIMCKGRTVRPSSAEKLSWYRQLVQYIPQDPSASLHPRMTVRQLVEEPLRCLGVDCDLEARVREALESVGLSNEFLRRRRNELSGGQAQRVAIARAIVTCPAFLIADEPVSGLDLPVRRQVSAVLLDLSEMRQTGLLVVSHDIMHLAHICTRIMVMHQGCIIEDRPTAEVIGNPNHPHTRELIAAARPSTYRVA